MMFPLTITVVPRTLEGEDQPAQRSGTSESRVQFDVPRELADLLQLPSRDGAALRDDDGGCKGNIGCWDDENGWQWGPGGQNSGIALIAAAALIALSLGINELVRGAIETSWASFPISGEDTITMSESAGTAGELTVTLSAGPGITWWKSAEIYDVNGNLRGAAWTKDSVTSNTTSVAMADLHDNSFLVLKKAKTFGVHTSMYVIRNLQDKDGRALMFTWTKD
jgi:hypothetical protein